MLLTPFRMKESCKVHFVDDILIFRLQNTSPTGENLF